MRSRSARARRILVLAALALGVAAPAASASPSAPPDIAPLVGSDPVRLLHLVRGDGAWDLWSGHNQGALQLFLRYPDGGAVGAPCRPPRGRMHACLWDSDLDGRVSLVIGRVRLGVRSLSASTGPGEPVRVYRAGVVFMLLAAPGDPPRLLVGRDKRGRVISRLRLPGPPTG